MKDLDISPQRGALKYDLTNVQVTQKYKKRFNNI